MLECPAPLKARGFSLRHEAQDDLPSLRRMFAADRWGLFAHLPLPDEQKWALLSSQFDMQRRYYLSAHADTVFLALAAAEGLAGRLCLACEGEVRLLVDILIRPDLRGQGIGAALLTGLIGGTEGAVRLHVDKTNPARRLYDRLGFEVVGESELAWRMERKGMKPEASRPPSSTFPSSSSQA